MADILSQEKTITLPKDKMLGYCSSCGAKIIEAKKVGLRKASLRKLLNYKEHIVELSNGTIMRVAVCDKCKTELVAGKSQEIADKIIDNHIKYWDKVAVKKEIPNDYKTITVVNSNTDLGTFLKKQEAEKLISIKLK